MKTKKQLDQKKLALFALILATSLTFAACTPTTQNSVNKPTASPLPPATVVEDSVPSAVGENSLNPSNNSMMASTSGTTDVVDPTTGVRTINVEAGSFYYKPDVIRVKKGEKIKLVINSVDMMHDFNVDELKLRTPVTKSGTTSTTEFTAPLTAGTYKYYCSVGQHRDNGQVGTLIIE